MNYLHVSEKNMRHVTKNKNFHCNLIIKRKIDQRAKNESQNSPVNVNINSPISIDLNSSVNTDLNNPVNINVFEDTLDY